MADSPFSEIEAIDSLESLALPDLLAGFEGLTKAQGEALAEAASVCLEKVGNVSGECIFRVLYGGERFYQLTWLNVTRQMRNCHKTSRATEDGACGIAILLMKELEGYEVLEKAEIGTGVDYWLFKNPPVDEENFLLGSARLEVSGLLNYDDSEFKSRLQKKIGQTQKTKNKGPGYTVVVAFSTPYAEVAVT